MLPVEVDSSTLVITSIVSAAITFGFCRAMSVSSSGSVVIAAVVGIALYVIGVIPIGLLAVVGIAMLIGIVKAAFKSDVPPE